MKIHFAEGARYWWRQASTWVTSVALFIQGAMIVDAGSILQGLGLMPPHLRGMIPVPVMQGLTGVLFVLSMLSILARQVKQPKLQAKIEAKKEQSNGE